MILNLNTYLKGKLMHVADLLSRSFLEATEHDDSYMYEVVHCVRLPSCLQFTEEQKQELIAETLKDDDLLNIIDFTKNERPEKVTLYQIQ